MTTAGMAINPSSQHSDSTSPPPLSQAKTQPDHSIIHCIASIKIKLGSPPPRGRLSEEKNELTLLPQLGLSLLHGCDEHVANTGIGKSVKMRAETVRLDNEERLGAAVVRTIHHGARRQTECKAKLVAGGSRACTSRPSEHGAQRIARRATEKQWFDRDSTKQWEEFMSRAMEMNDKWRTYRASTFCWVVLRMAGRS